MPATDTPARPNILLLMMDQLRVPRLAYGPDAGEVEDIKKILAFEPDIGESNTFAKYFEGFLALRKNAVVLRNHMIATSACSPSRTSIMTGQYGTRTGVTQTDGLFKTAEDMTWLDPDGIPTIGDWFRQAGYQTHYFGKWHVSDPTEGTLEPWGFADYELSKPEPHGSDPRNLGTNRDIGFTDLVTTFLRRKAVGLGDDPTQPWFAVGSLVNPHDIDAYPTLWSQAVDVTDHRLPEPRAIPKPGARSTPPSNATLRVPLNPGDFPQESAALPPHVDEDLSTKPDCQLDYAYKMGLALKAKPDKQALRDLSPLPYQVQPRATEWLTDYIQFYTYLQYLVDLQFRRIMGALEESGLMENTIVIFLSDHGEMASAHGGMTNKWHQAYEETINVPCIVSSPLVNPDTDNMRSVEALTSHIDIAPTLLGLAGFTSADIQVFQAGLAQKGQTPLDFVGSDLSPLIRGDADAVEYPGGGKREGVLFITDDTITAPANAAGAETENYRYFLGKVNELVQDGTLRHEGSVTEPCHVRAVRTKAWKFVRYWDPSGRQPDQFELYTQTHDPTEIHNLVGWRDGEPYVRDLPVLREWGLTTAEVEAELKRLRAMLARLEATMLPVPETETVNA